MEFLLLSLPSEISMEPEMTAKLLGPTLNHFCGKHFLGLQTLAWEIPGDLAIVDGKGVRRKLSTNMMPLCLPLEAAVSSTES